MKRFYKIMKTCYTLYRNMGVKSAQENTEEEFSRVKISILIRTSIVASYSLVNSAAVLATVDASYERESDIVDVPNIMGEWEKMTWCIDHNQRLWVHRMNDRCRYQYHNKCKNRSRWFTCGTLYLVNSSPTSVSTLNPVSPEDNGCPIPSLSYFEPFATVHSTPTAVPTS